MATYFFSQEAVLLLHTALRRRYCLRFSRHYLFSAALTLLAHMADNAIFIFITF